MANGILSLMTWDDLRLSLEESKGIAKLKGRGRIEGRTIAKIHAKCEGWAASLFFLLELSKCHSIEDLLSIEETSCQKIFDYFSGEVFECLDAPMQTLLLRTKYAKCKNCKAKFLAAHKDELIREMVENRIVLRPPRVEAYLNQRFFGAYRGGGASQTGLGMQD